MKRVIEIGKNEEIKDFKIKTTVNLMFDHEIETVIYKDNSFIKVVGVENNSIKIQKG